MDAPMTKADLLAESADLVKVARWRELALLRGRMNAADAAHKKAVAIVKDGAPPAGDLAALRAEIAIMDARLTAAVEACATRLDEIENSPPRSWSFDVIRDPAGNIAEIVANPV